MHLSVSLNWTELLLMRSDIFLERNSIFVFFTNQIVYMEYSKKKHRVNGVIICFAFPKKLLKITILHETSN